MKDHQLLPSHQLLVDTFSVAAHEKWLTRRDAAVTRIYYDYGLHHTRDVMGWTKPTILACVNRHEEAEKKKARRKA